MPLDQVVARLADVHRCLGTLTRVAA
jgi:hypothetical protein